MSKKFSLSVWQKQILNVLAKSDINKIAVWGGGTALADIYLGHRLSYDLDFFIDYPLTEGESNLILAMFHQLKIKNINYKQEKNRWFYSVIKDGDQLKVEFVYYPFRRLGKPHKTKYGVKVESLSDLTASKAFTLYERAEPKDAYDLFAIMNKSNNALERIIKNTNRKFGVDIDPVYFSAQLTKAVENFDLIRVLLLDDKDTKKELENYFNPRIKKLVLQKIPA